jgi:hypothetical protein
LVQPAECPPRVGVAEASSWLLHAAHLLLLVS